MDLAPVEYIIINFPDDDVHGEIAPAIADLVDRGVVRILDLVFVRKDSEGAVSIIEYDELSEAGVFASIEGEADGVLGEEDLLLLAADLPPSSTALFVLWEDRWADDLGRAVWAAGGEVVAGGRIPRDVVVASLGAATPVSSPTSEVPA